MGRAKSFAGFGSTHGHHRGVKTRQHRPNRVFYSPTGALPHVNAESRKEAITMLQLLLDICFVEQPRTSEEVNAWNYNNPEIDGLNNGAQILTLDLESDRKNIQDNDYIFLHIHDADELNYLKILGILVTPENVSELLSDFRDHVTNAENYIGLTPHRNSISTDVLIAAILRRENVTDASRKQRSYKHMLRKMLKFWKKSENEARSCGVSFESNHSATSSDLFPLRTQTVQEDDVPFFNSSTDDFPSTKRKRSWFKQRAIKNFFQIQKDS
ncbi:hypothetical protein KLMA_20261 [Kluyveromyces marxianus]|nr:hypothetical protein KLMA_20261 [Kluyveromyces marxianus]